jgi:large subunit ribosomal protein L4
MISVPVKDMSGNEVGTYEFDPADLAPGINKQLLHDVVVMYEANRRVGTSATRSRGMVSGSTKKLYRQKGTGRARMGPRRNPVRRGGGHTFAKRPRNWGYRLPRKSVRLATRMALLSKFQDEEAIVLDDIAVDAPKTKVVVGMLRALGVDRDSCLLAVDRHDENVWKSARNISELRVAPWAELNAYDLLRQKRLVITRSAIDRLRGHEG